MASRVTGVCQLVLALSLAGTLAAQEEPAPAEPAAELTIEQLRSLVVEQQGQIEQQQSRLEEQEKRIQDQAALLQELLGRVERVETEAPELSDESLAVIERVAREQAAEQATAAVNSRQETVADEGFPGAIRLPGTSISMRPGGLVNVSLVQSSEQLGIEDRFVTALIPVGDDTGLSTGAGAAVSARRSRLNLDVRRESDLGEFRAFVEGDFLGEGADGSDTFRLRHAFGQFRDLTIGQTWSSFNNPFAGPEEIDLEGINADVIVRQPLLRWEDDFKKGRLAISFEEPQPDVTGATGKSRFWDTISRYSRQGDRVTYHAAGMARQIAAEPEGTDVISKFAWGATGAARWSITRWNQDDSLLIQGTLGRGVGRYINDLNAAGGLDGYIDSETGDLEIPFATAFLFAYHHRWAFEWRGFRSLRSTFTLGLVNVDYPTDPADDAYDRTVRSSFNVLWSPLSGVDVGLEWLWGRRENVDGEHGTASQLQFATYFRF